jgi:hypothetical protein
VAHTGEIHRLRVRATEKTVWQITPESYGMLSTYPWFPQEPAYLGGLYTFDWTVKVLRPLRAVGSGSTVREWEDEKARLNCIQMKSETPLTFPSLIFGAMKETLAEHPPRSGGPPVKIRVHWIPQITFSDTTADYRSVPDTYKFSVPAGKPKQIAAEAASIIGFYESIFGPYPSGELDIAQMGPGLWFAQAPPGLVQLTSEYFLSQGLIGSWTDDPRTMEFIRTVLAHEIAHHYWGTVVSWKSEEDQWLSESLAEYSSGLYSQAADGEKSFRQMLKSWRQDTERWESPIPIAHANRTSGEERWIERRALLYSKGPMVIHMLRAMLGPDKFVAALKKLLSDHRGRAIETADFQRAVEAVAGQPMASFFDQWVWRAGIPEIHWTYRATPAADGKYLIDLSLKQSNLPEPKPLLIPIAFRLDGGRSARKDWHVVRIEETLQIMLPGKPRSALLDEPGDLLARFVFEKSRP